MYTRAIAGTNGKPQVDLPQRMNCLLNESMWPRVPKRLGPRLLHPPSNATMGGDSTSTFAGGNTTINKQESQQHQIKVELGGVYVWSCNMAAPIRAHGPCSFVRRPVFLQTACFLHFNRQSSRRAVHQTREMATTTAVATGTSVAPSASVVPIPSLPSIQPVPTDFHPIGIDPAVGGMAGTDEPLAASSSSLGARAGHISFLPLTSQVGNAFYPTNSPYRRSLLQ